MREVNVRGIDLNLLALLDVLLTHRSVTRAAQAANLSQPAMSRALGRLRALFDDQLLVRGSNGLVPTPRAASISEGSWVSSGSGCHLSPAEGWLRSH